MDKDSNKVFPHSMTALEENANILHEVFLSYQAAGFSEQQSLYLTGVAISSLLGAGPSAG